MSKHWLPKEDAAELLGVSTRQIERMAAAGKLRAQRVKLEGDRTPRTVYAEDDLQRTKPRELAVQERAADRETATGWRMPTLAELLATKPRAEPRAWLTVEQAAEHSGLPAPLLHELVKSGQVHALGRGPATWRIQRASLDAFGTALPGRPSGRNARPRR